MFDTKNRVRNLLGNYRYVSYLMRFWRLRDRLGLGENRLEKTLLARAVKGYGLPRPWTSVDLGCGNYPHNPFAADNLYGCDLRENPAINVRGCDLVLEPIPYGTESLDFVTAYNFIEHVPRIVLNASTRFPFMELMAEIHRVLKPGGLFYAKTPAYPSEEVFQDPTHINFITSDTFPLYFCWHPYGGPWGRLYGFAGKFELVVQRREGPYLLSVLKKSLAP